MRGGAIPVLVWGTLLLILATMEWIWDATVVNPWVFLFAVLVIYLFGVFLWLANRDAVRKGPPESKGEPEAVPRSSLAAATAGVSVALIVYGIEFGAFLIFIGGGLLLLSLGRLGRELIWQQRSLQAVRRRRGAP
jgi:uncharacterized iron-regulated membrane protein